MIINILRTILQWTWGLPQNLAGLAVFLFNIARPHRISRGCVITEWKSRDSCMGLGMFIFMGEDDRENEEILAHEYGHTIQSLILGPLFIPVIALPSLVWANFRPLSRMRKRKGVSYYRFYPERWANHIAVKRIGKAPEQTGMEKDGQRSLCE